MLHNYYFFLPVYYIFLTCFFCPTRSISVISTQSVNIRFSLLRNGTTSDYQETHNVITDANGIVTVSIGEGNVISGNFASIDWSINTYFLKVEIDISNGAGYQDFGTTELKAVPYAKYADQAGNVFSGNFGDLNNVPAGLADGDDVNDADYDASNELQTLSFDNGTRQLSIANGNTVVIPVGSSSSGDGWGTQVVVSDASLTGDGTSSNPLAIDDTSSIFNGWDKDASDDFDGNFSHLSNVPAGLADGDDDTHLTDAQIAAMGYTKNTNDADFYIMTTTNQPTAITDDIYHTGKMAIGTTQSDASTNDKLTVITDIAGGYAISAKQNNADNNISDAVAKFAYQNTKISSKITGYLNENSSGYYYAMNNVFAPESNSAIGINNKFNLNGNGNTMGVINSFSGTVNNSIVYGSINSFSTDGNSMQTAVVNLIGGTNSSLMTGIRNDINNSGNSFHFGVNSTLNGSGSGIHCGVQNTLSGVGEGQQYGVNNDISNSKDGEHYGISNSLSGTGTGSHIGVRNYLSNNGSGSHTGTYNSIEGDGNGVHIGSDNYLTGSGTGDKYGVRSVVRSDTGGKHYGIYAKATKNATDVYAGYFLGKVSVGTNDYDSYILPKTNGNDGQIMQIDANKQVNWVDMPSNADNWGTQVVVSDVTLLGDGTTANPLTIDINSSVFSGWDKDASDDFSGDYDDLINQPITFYKVNTTSAPTSINDTIFTHGNIGIGDISPLSPLSIMTDSGFAIDVYVDDSTDANHVGNNVAFYNSGNGSIKGFQVIDNNSGNGNRVGQDIYLQGTGSGGKIGVNSSIFGGSGSATYMGVKSTISSNNTGAHYGVYSELTGTGNGDKYGSYNTIDVSAGGTHYAVYGDAQKPGSYAGYFVGEVNVSQGYLMVEQKIISPISGDSDLKAYIYGYVFGNGDLDPSKSSTGFLASYNNSDMCYDIVFDDMTVEDYIVVADVNSVEPLIVTVDRQTGVCKIYVYDLNSTLAMSDFHFVVYKK